MNPSRQRTVAVVFAAVLTLIIGGHSAGADSIVVFEGHFSRGAADDTNDEPDSRESREDATRIADAVARAAKQSGWTVVRRGQVCRREDCLSAATSEDGIDHAMSIDVAPLGEGYLLIVHRASETDTEKTLIVPYSELEDAVYNDVMILLSTLSAGENSTSDERVPPQLVSTEEQLAPTPPANRATKPSDAMPPSAFRPSWAPFVSSLSLTAAFAVAGGLTLGLANREGRDIDEHDLETETPETAAERRFRHLTASSRVLLPLAGVGFVTSIALSVYTYRERRERITLSAALSSDAAVTTLSYRF